MKLASLKAGRDGRLAIVARDLRRCTDASAIAPTLQAALDDWDRLAPMLAALAQGLDQGGPGQPFDPAQAASPLPRAYQWADGSAYVNHVELVRRARGRRAAGELLDRSVDVPGRLGRVSRARRPHPAGRRGLGSRL